MGVNRWSIIARKLTNGEPLVTEPLAELVEDGSFAGSDVAIHDSQPALVSDGILALGHTLGVARCQVEEPRVWRGREGILVQIEISAVHRRRGSRQRGRHAHKPSKHIGGALSRPNRKRWDSRPRSYKQLRAEHRRFVNQRVPTGKQVTFVVCNVFHREESKFVKLWDYVDWPGLFQQLGVVPPLGIEARPLL